MKLKYTRLLKFKTFFLVLTVCLFLSSCKRLGLCKDKKLGFDRVENTSNLLQLSGYYYGPLKGEGSNVPSIYTFHANGVIYHNYQRDSTSAANGSIELNNSSLRINHKTNWGIYKIEGNQIEIQHWLDTKTCHDVGIFIGHIENDSTYRITSTYDTRTRDIKTIDETFRFVPFSPKSDSITSFIP